MESHRPTPPLLVGEESDRQGEVRSLLLRVLDRSARPDPYPLFNRIREAGPLWWDGETVVFSSFRHCAAVLGHPGAVAPSAGCPVGSGEQPQVLAMSATGSPEHARLRRLVTRALTPARVRGLVPFVRSLVDDALDGVAARGRLEVVTDLAYPLPTAVICRLLGIAPEHAPRLHKQVLLLSPRWTRIRC